MAQKKRIIGYDYLRIIAMFMVVVIHGNVALLAKRVVAPLMVMEITAFCLVSVPCFLMISGALLLDTEVSPSWKFLKNRLVKQGVPFAVWSLGYVVVRMVLGKIPAGIQAFTSLLQEPAYYQFWFMYTLLAIYLLLPALISLVQHISEEVYQYLLEIWLLFSVLQPTLAQFFPIFRLSQHVDLVLCEGYVGFFLLGFYLKKYGAEVPISRAVRLMVCGYILTGILIFAEYVYSGANFQGFFYRSYLTPGVVIASSGVFLFFQNSDYVGSNVVTKLSNVSIGIFYLHMLVMTAFEYVGFSGAESLLVCGVKCLAVYVLSVAMALGIARMPIIRTILLGMN